MTATAIARIEAVDRQIDRNEAVLMRRAGLTDASDYDAWGAAWKHNPVLARRETALYRFRGRLQLLRDRTGGAS